MEVDPQSELVDYLDVADVLLRLGIAPGEIRIGLRLPGPSHIFGGYRHTIGPRDTRAQLEIECPAVCGPLEALDESRLEGWWMLGVVGLLLEEVQKEAIEDSLRLGVEPRDQRVDSMDIIADRYDQRAAAPGNGGRG